MTMRNNDIAVTYVKFVDKHNGKTRPIVIIDQNERDYIAFKLTTQFAHKSAKIQANYYEMKEWHFSGLDKKTWIDTSTSLAISKSHHFEMIGRLQRGDVVGLNAFLLKHRT